MVQASAGVGASIPRTEDDRFLRCRGQYVGDLRMPGTQDVAFVRSAVAHARIRGIQIPESVRRDVFTAEDLADVKPIRFFFNDPATTEIYTLSLHDGSIVRRDGEVIHAD